MPFRIAALPAASFGHLFGRRDAELRAVGVLALTADAAGAFACRISLADAEPGDRMLLLNFEHQPADTPYRSRHAIFVRDGAVEAVPAPGEVPARLAARLLSVRSFDADGMMMDGEVVAGSEAAACFEAMPAAPGAASLHVHSARRGCYLARVDRYRPAPAAGPYRHDRRRPPPALCVAPAGPLAA